jgi:tetratricopeptide (TPR) repeat protein
MNKGIECFENAIEIEPDYALAHAGIADAYSMLGAYYFLPAKESYPKAIEAAQKAIELDNSLAEAHCALGYAIYEFNWDWIGAEESFKKGLKINPGYSFGHASYAHCLLMLGRFDDAMREIKLARELDPLGLITNANVGYAYFLSRKYDAALKEYNKALVIDPNFYPLLGYIAEVYEQKEMLHQALETMQLAYNKSEMNPKLLAELGHIYALSGNKMEALTILDQLKEKSKSEFISASHFAMVYLGLNDKEQIFQWLKKSYEEKAPFMCYLKVDPRFDKIRSDERFLELMKNVGLVTNL